MKLEKMTYIEFKTNKSYKPMLHTYPNIAELWTENNEENIVETVTRYAKRGSRWVEIEEPKIQKIDYVGYSNVVSAIPFFRNLGGKEIVKQGYTKRGYLPTTIHSISPDRKNKTVREYQFL